MGVGEMLASAFYSSVRQLSGILLLLLAGSFPSASAMPAPTPTSVGLNWMLPFDVERSAQESLSDAFGGANPCRRPEELSWVPVPAWEQVVVLDFQEVFRKATVERRLTMLVIYGEDCSGWTRMVRPLLSNKETLSITKNEFHIIPINGDDDEQMFLIDGRTFSAPQLVDMLGVEQFPTFVVFEDDGKLVLILEHPESQQELRSAIKYAVKSKQAMLSGEQNEPYNAADGNLHALLAQRAQLPSQIVLNFDERVDERPLAVFFEKPDCRHCDHFRKHILSDTRTRSLLERFRIARVELSSTAVLISPPDRRLTVAQWSRELGVTNTPSVVLFDKSGKRIRHSSDHTDLYRFQSLLDYVVSGAYESDSSFAHYLWHRRQHLREHGYEIDTRLF
jgi:thioredoxin-related protein